MSLSFWSWKKRTPCLDSSAHNVFKEVESEGIFPTWGMNGDRICHRKNVCMALQQLPGEDKTPRTQIPEDPAWRTSSPGTKAAHGTRGWEEPAQKFRSQSWSSQGGQSQLLMSQGLGTAWWHLEGVVTPSPGDLLLSFPPSLANLLLPESCQNSATPNTGTSSHDPCSWPHPPQRFFILASSAQREIHPFPRGIELHHHSQELWEKLGRICANLPQPLKPELVWWWLTNECVVAKGS